MAILTLPKLNVNSYSLPRNLGGLFFQMLNLKSLSALQYVGETGNDNRNKAQVYIWVKDGHE
jgi:hypothetical protein